MKAWEIIGWVFDGACYCTDHKPKGNDDEVSPIFASAEGNEDTTCDICNCSLTEEWG
jgi:hypothetical protein